MWRAVWKWGIIWLVQGGTRIWLLSGALFFRGAHNPLFGCCHCLGMFIFLRKASMTWASVSLSFMFLWPAGCRLWGVGGGLLLPRKRRPLVLVGWVTHPGRLYWGGWIPHQEASSCEVLAHEEPEGAKKPARKVTLHLLWAPGASARVHAFHLFLCALLTGAGGGDPGKQMQMWVYEAAMLPGASPLSSFFPSNILASTEDAVSK